MHQRVGETQTWTFTWDQDWTGYTGTLRVGTWGDFDFVTSSSVTVVSATVLTADLDLTGVAPGRYHTQLHVEDGSGNLFIPQGPTLIVETAIPAS